MKKAMKWILPIMLAILLVVSLGWYMFVYDTATVQDFLNAQAKNLAESGNFKAATWIYNQSSKLSGNGQNAAIDLAEVYKSVGNYTKAETTLAKAIASGANTELYIALCQTYVEQDKLLDAVNMLDNISDTSIKDELDKMRPAAPLPDYEAGFYNQYISLTFSNDSGTLFVTSDGQYPSIEDAPYTEPVTLRAGENKVYALCVGENGLVSPVSILSYTVAGIIEQVTLEDATIEADVRAQLLFGENTPIYTSDLWTFSDYTVPADAATVTDLKYMTQLKKLTVTDKRLDSLSFLSAMTGLQELHLVNCSLSDELEIIAALPALKVLTLSGCNLSSIAKLEKAVNLTSLDLSSNAIGDISILAGMTQLSTLNISHNAVTNISALSSLKQLTSLDASYNSISSLSPIGSCTNLTQLNVTSNQLEDLSPVSSLKGLTELMAAYNKLTDVSPLSGCTQIQVLDVSNNSLENIWFLSPLVNMTYLNFSHNAVTALPDLPKDCALVEVNGEHNYLDNVNVLCGMENLNLVCLDYNNITDISGLADCPVLEQVNVYSTNVSDVEALLEHSIIVNYDPT